MKKKLLMSVVVMFVLFAGVVGAASLNGDFMGNPIVKVKSDGKVLPIEDTPAILYNNRTMVPIYMLRQLGVEVDWIAEEYAVDVRLPKQETATTSKVDIDELHNQLGVENVALVEYSRLGENLTQLSFIFLFDTNTEKSEIYDRAINYAYDKGITQVRIEDITGQAYFIQMSDLKLYYEGKISIDEYFNRLEYVQLPYHPQGDSNVIDVPFVTNYPELYSNDGKTYLGKLTTNSYDTDSIYNEYGTYGSKYSTDSIWNEYGTYGSKFSNQSAFNNYATEPPIIVFDGQVIGYLTTNTTILDGISPLSLSGWLQDNGY